MTGELAAAAAAVGAFVVAVAAVWRQLGLGSVLRGTRLFLLDWFGEPARPGVEARPSFPERMDIVERRTGDLNHVFRGELSSQLTLLAYSVERLHDHSTVTADTLNRMDERITDHRRRNDEQVALLREAIHRQEQAIAAIRARSAQRRRTDPPDPALTALREDPP